MYGQTVLHMVCGGRDVEDRRHEVIRCLVENQADMECTDVNMRTPLHVCAGSGYKNGAQELFDLGANMLALGRNGRNFADMAIKSNRRMVEWWRDITGKEPTGRPPQQRDGMFMRKTMTEKRKQRMKENKAEREGQRKYWAAEKRKANEGWDRNNVNTDFYAQKSREKWGR